jgi:hypothetical protein
MREFREQVAALFTNYAAFREHARSHTTGDPEKEKRLAEINDAMTLRFHTIRLLIAEKGTHYGAFVANMERLLNATTFEAGARSHEIYVAAEDILRSESAAIAADPGVWRAVLTSLGLRAAQWQPWPRIRAWLRRDPPHFPDLP